MMNKGYLKTEHLKLLILDEVDQLLSGNFEDQIHTMLRNNFTDNENCQVCLFTATLTKKYQEVCEELIREDAVKIYVDAEN